MVNVLGRRSIARITPNDALPKTLRRLLCGFSSVNGGGVGEGGVKCSCAASERFLRGRAESGGESILVWSGGRRRYVSLDAKGVDLGGCWSPGSSPGIISYEG